MSFEVQGDATFAGTHASGGAEIQVKNNSTANQGKAEFKVQNDMNVTGDLKVGGSHAKSKAVIKRNVKPEDVELSETDKNIRVRGNLNVGGEHASDGAKIVDNSTDYKLIFGCLAFAATAALVAYKLKQHKFV